MLGSLFENGQCTEFAQTTERFGRREKEKVKKGNSLVRGCVTDGVGVRLKEGIERGSQLFNVTRVLDPVNQSSPSLWVVGVFFELVVENIVPGDVGWWEGVWLRFGLEG